MQQIVEGVPARASQSSRDLYMRENNRARAATLRSGRCGRSAAGGSRHPAVPSLYARAQWQELTEQTALSTEGSPNGLRPGPGRGKTGPSLLDAGNPNWSMPTAERLRLHKDKRFRLPSENNSSNRHDRGMARLRIISLPIRKSGRRERSGRQLFSAARGLEGGGAPPP